MLGWSIAVIIAWAVVVTFILFIFVRAVHRHSRRAGPSVQPFPLETRHSANRSLNHNSVLLYPPSARSVGLTPEQVANAAPVTSIVPFEEETCTICLEDMIYTQRAREIRVCSHVFHSACIRNWLHRNNTCPNCQRIVVEEPSMELEIESVSSKDWRSFGYDQWVGQPGHDEYPSRLNNV